VSVFVFFFFSSRRRHTRLQGDWSSDVCSSDLSSAAQALSRASTAPARASRAGGGGRSPAQGLRRRRGAPCLSRVRPLLPLPPLRSEERRVGKACCLAVARDASWKESCDVKDHG